MRKDRPYPGAIWVGEPFADLDRQAGATVEAAAGWLRTTPEPFFLFVHLFDPHAPYAPPQNYLSQLSGRHFDTDGRWVAGCPDVKVERILRRYHAEVAFVDQALDALLREVAERTSSPRLVVVAADHGDGPGQRSHVEHTFHLHDELLQVPLLFHWPTHFRAGARIRTPAGIVDVAPTLFDLLGLPALPAADGRSLTESLVSGVEPEDGPIFANRRSFSESYPPPRGRQVAIRTGRWKYIRRDGAGDELYDLQGDPGEKTNRIDLESEAVALDAAITEFESRMPAPDDPADLDEDVREKLRALGYAE